MTQIAESPPRLDKMEMKNLMLEAEKRVSAKKSGYLGGTVASILAILSIFILGVIFLPIAILIALFSTSNALINGNIGGVLYNILAWVLIVIGASTSPVFLVLLASLGFSMNSPSNYNYSPVSTESSEYASEIKNTTVKQEVIKSNILEKGLINSMMLNVKTKERIGDSGKAIQAYIQSSFLEKKPTDRFDYTDYWVLKKPAYFLGHELKIIEEEYMTRYVGCCVSNGVGATLKVKKDLNELEKFAKNNGCSLNKNINYKEEISNFNLTTNDSGEYVSLSCRDRDIP